MNTPITLEGDTYPLKNRPKIHPIELLFKIYIYIYTVGGETPNQPTKHNEGGGGGLLGDVGGGGRWRHPFSPP